LFDRRVGILCVRSCRIRDKFQEGLNVEAISLGSSGGFLFQS
jgi:hypothetical protein